DVTTRRKTLGHYRSVVRKFFERWSAEVIHLHGADFYEYLPPAGVPVLVTLHLPPQCYPPEIFRLTRPQTYLHCLSEFWRRACPPCPYLLPAADAVNSNRKENELHSTEGAARLPGIWENVLQKYIAVYRRLAGVPDEPMAARATEVEDCPPETNTDFS